MRVGSVVAVIYERRQSTSEVAERGLGVVYCYHVKLHSGLATFDSNDSRD
jgi:hypothetical protein